MTPEQFVDGVGEVVLKASVSSTISVLDKPPGRQPPRSLTALSTWFKRLHTTDREMVEAVLTMVARQSVFGFLAVLDGSRPIEPSMGPKGHFELRYVKDENQYDLAGPRGKVLHELLGGNSS